MILSHSLNDPYAILFALQYKKVLLLCALDWSNIPALKVNHYPCYQSCLKQDTEIQLAYNQEHLILRITAKDAHNKTRHMRRYLVIGVVHVRHDRFNQQLPKMPIGYCVCCGLRHAVIISQCPSHVCRNAQTCLEQQVP